MCFYLHIKKDHDENAENKLYQISCYVICTILKTIVYALDVEKMLLIIVEWNYVCRLVIILIY